MTAMTESLLSLPDRLKKLRKEKKLSQAALAKIAGVSSPAVTQWEAGTSAPKITPAKKLADHFGLPISYFNDELGAIAEGSTDFVSAQKIQLEDLLRSQSQVPVFTKSDFNSLDVKDLAAVTSHVFSELKLSNQSYAVSIEDQAMLPEIQPSDRLLIDPAVQPVPGDLVAVHSHRTHESYIRKYRALGFNAGGDLIFEARPVDADYPVLQAESDLLQVLGVVVEHRRIRKRT